MGSQGSKASSGGQLISLRGSICAWRICNLVENGVLRLKLKMCCVKKCEQFANVLSWIPVLRSDLQHEQESRAFFFFFEPECFAILNLTANVSLN